MHLDDIPLDARVLVAVVTRPCDLAKAREEGWYRIPLARAPCALAAEYLAFYQTAALGGALPCGGAARGDGDAGGAAAAGGRPPARRGALLSLRAGAAARPAPAGAEPAAAASHVHPHDVRAVAAGARRRRVVAPVRG